MMRDNPGTTEAQSIGKPDVWGMPVIVMLPSFHTKSNAQRNVISFYLMMFGFVKE